MAQSITWLGNTYTQVPAILLPKTGGGTARFTDTTPTTATDSDVAQGKIYIKADGTQSTGTASGGGGGGGIEITQDVQGYIVLPKTGGGGGGGGGGTPQYGSVFIQNNTSAQVQVMNYGLDTNGNPCNYTRDTTISPGAKGEVSVMYQRNGTTYVNSVVGIHCTYASYATNMTVSGSSSTYKIGTGIGTGALNAYVRIYELDGSTVTIT